MAERAEKAQDKTPIGSEQPLFTEACEGRTMPPSTLPLSPSAGRPERAGPRAALRTRAANEEQLPLPLDEQLERPISAPQRQTSRRKGGKGFVPVTRDPDVARSYSENAALDNAIAQGLSQALATLPPEELAALRQKVAKAARRNGKVIDRATD